MYKINYENATERRTVKEHMLMPTNDGQVKHPEHLREHEMMVKIQRLALNGEVEKVKEFKFVVIIALFVSPNGDSNLDFSLFFSAQIFSFCLFCFLNSFVSLKISKLFNLLP